MWQPCSCISCRLILNANAPTTFRRTGLASVSRVSTCTARERFAADRCFWPKQNNHMVCMLCWACPAASIMLELAVVLFVPEIQSLCLRDGDEEETSNLKGGSWWDSLLIGRSPKDIHVRLSSIHIRLSHVHVISSAVNATFIFSCNLNRF
jgi:hypothetical protein